MYNKNGNDEGKIMEILNRTECWTFSTCQFETLIISIDINLNFNQ